MITSNEACCHYFYKFKSKSEKSITSGLTSTFCVNTMFCRRTLLSLTSQVMITNNEHENNSSLLQNFNLPRYREMAALGHHSPFQVACKVLAVSIHLDEPKHAEKC